MWLENRLYFKNKLLNWAVFLYDDSEVIIFGKTTNRLCSFEFQMQSLFPLPKNDQKWSKITPQKDILVRFCRIVPLDVAKISMKVVTNGDVKFSKNHITEEILVYKL